MRVLTWNLFHGRAKPAAGRPLLVEFTRALAGWDWDLALLQEVPPWWPPILARASGAQQRTALTSRNQLLALRRAVAVRNPDLIASNGGGANAILARGPIGDHREVELTKRPERRAAHAISLPGGGWVVNLHATKEDDGARRDVDRARAAALEWAGGEPIVLGGDFNLTHPTVEGFEPVAGHWVDHVFTRGLHGRDAEALDAGTLSDHKPLAVEVSASG